MCRSQTTRKHRFPKLQLHHHWFFKSKYQKPHLERLGSLVFWVCLALSEPTWSASIGTAALANSKTDQRESFLLPNLYSPFPTPPQQYVQQEETPPRCDKLEDPPSQPVSDPVSRVTGHQTQTHQQNQPCSPTLPSPPIEVKISSTSELEPTSIENPSDSDQAESGEDPDLGNLRLREIAEPPDSDQAESGQDPDLGNLRLREIAEPPDSDQAESGADPDLGNLRLREIAEPPPPSEPTAYLLAGVGYFRSNNIFSGVDPVDDGLLSTGVTLLATPSLGPQTSLFAAVGGNLLRYQEESDSDYDELRFDAGIRQQIASGTYGELGWRNRQLFTDDGGDRFLNDHSVYLELSRRDSLAQKLTLDSFYELRVSFADPSNRSQLTNSVGVSLAYNPFPPLEVALDYQFAFADFTEQEREDQYHQLIGRLSYTLSRNSRLYLFGGHSFGDSSDSEVDFDGLVFGVGVDLNLTLF